MIATPALWLEAIVVGVVATLAMDAFVLLRKRLWGVASLDYRMVGRWIGHMFHGQFHHAQIAAAQATRNERALGWSVHYLIGIVFALGLVALSGPTPSFEACVFVGLVTSAAPFFVMQPALGAGFAAGKTPRPWISRASTLLTHGVFGLGLFLGTWVYSGVFQT
jgi:hypothetical protein